MAQKCTHCGKKYGRQLKSCPFCSNNSNQDRLSLENFFNNVEIKFLDNQDNFTDSEWNSLYKLAEDTFVEESDSLKQSGAGAGLTDND